MPHDATRVISLYKMPGDAVAYAHGYHMLRSEAGPQPMRIPNEVNSTKPAGLSVVHREISKVSVDFVEIFHLY
jgi:hypothetical protein